MERDYLVQNPRKRLNPPDTLDAGGLLPPGYGIPMNNPYEIHIMQRAIDSLCLEQNLGPIILLPTDVYVRFLPKDSLEYNALLSLDTELFDYPLTYEFPEGMDSFRDPSVPDTLITWQYTVVPYRTILPDIQYEVLDTCYIPPEEPDRSLPSDFYYRLEMLADSLANPTRPAFHRSSPPSRAGVYPSGTVRAMPSHFGSPLDPVRGVKVRIQGFVKCSVVYTNENGNYQSSKKFSYDPCYSIVFENSRGFSEYGTALSCSPTWESAGTQSKNGHVFTFNRPSKAWFASYVNNSYADYYDECVSSGITLPPSDMRLVLLSSSNNWSGGTPMLNKMGRTILSVYSVLDIMESLAYPSTDDVSVVIGPLLKYFLPDLIIRYDSDERLIIRCVHHELSHASHYVSSGGYSYWVSVIGHIVRSRALNQDLYGDGSINDNIQDASELTEAWAYANERLIQKVLSPDYIPNAGKQQWFNPSITALYNLMHSGTLTRAQILNRMDNSVASIDALFNKLMFNYMSQRPIIGRVFAEEGALSTQTRWRIINNSGESLWIKRKWGSYEEYSFLSDNDTTSFSAYPSYIKTFYALQGSMFYPSEILIMTATGLETVFHQTNGITSVPMHHPFFNSAEWNEVNLYIPIGNTTIRDFFYTITSYDLPEE